MSEQRDPEEAWLAGLTEPQWRGFIVRELQSIHAQTSKTNGRVTKLEVFRAMATGGLAVVLAVLVPLFVHVVTQ